MGTGPTASPHFSSMSVALPISIILALIAFAAFFILSFKFVSKYKSYSQLLKENQQQRAEKAQYALQIDDLSKERTNLQHDNKLLAAYNEKITAEVNNLRQQSFDLAQSYEEKKALYQEQEAHTLKEIADRKAQAELDEENVYTEVAMDFLNQWQQDCEKLNKERAALTAEVEQYRSTVASAVEIAKHNLEEKQEQDFFRLQLPEQSLVDINRLREVEPLLSQKEALNKVIWKVYYEKPYSDLIGRVIGAKDITGIYKITEIATGMAYVGQAVNVADRWKQHIKRGVGAEPPTQNKLYPAMKKIGPENFTFQLLEECPRTKLDEREDFWQDFYKVKEFGYSIK